MKNKITKEILATRRAVKERTLTFVLAALGLVASLAWNDAIQSFFNTILPKSQALIGKFTYAVFITIVVVFVSERLSEVISKKEDSEK